MAYFPFQYYTLVHVYRKSLTPTKHRILEKNCEHVKIDGVVGIGVGFKATCGGKEEYGGDSGIGLDFCFSHDLMWCGYCLAHLPLRATLHCVSQTDHHEGGATVA
jgi:hypothetical protein